MGPIERSLLDTRRAFDGVAATYDRSNTENRTLCAMRLRLLRTVESFVSPGSRILDLGCGPGADAEHFARRGDRVTAIDWSPGMVDEARRRVSQAGLSGRVDVRHLGIHQLGGLDQGAFDAALSDFGPLNCVPDLPEAARLIAARLRPGGVLVASVIGRVCPWEIGLYLTRRDWARIRIRFSHDPAPVPLNHRTVWTRYYTPHAFERAFAPAGFRRASLRALGLFVPPPYLEGFAGRHPRLIARLQQIEDLAGGWPGIRAWGDHFIIVLRKG